MVSLDDYSQDIDIKQAIEESFPPDNVDCVEAEHQSTAWELGYSTWRIRFHLPISWDVGAITHTIDNIPHIECDERHRPEGTLTVHPNGDVSLFIRTGPSIEEDEDD